MKYVVLTAAAVVLAAALAWFVRSHFSVAAQTPTTRTETLQKFTAKDPADCFAVGVTCDIRTLDHIDGWTTMVDKMQLEVRHYTLEPPEELAFELKISKSWTGNMLQVPTINRGRVDNAVYRGRVVDALDFPTGRIVTDQASGEILFVLFDGKAMQLLKFDRLSKKFLPTDPKPFAKTLKDFHATSFDPTDAQWCYCLVEHAPFFGAKMTARFDKWVTLEGLHKKWLESQN